MAYIELNTPLPGIAGPMMFRPETAKPLNELVDILLRQDNGLLKYERELIAAYVSHLNNCRFCTTFHGAMVQQHTKEDTLRQQVFANPETADVSPKLKALLAVAGKVAESGLLVQQTHIDRARNEGATDLEIHDTVLIAAVFCMCNRYVDGLGTPVPPNMEMYDQMAMMVHHNGYGVPEVPRKNS
jgi:uncharacterized peroxidase-related enzyme